ncbi:ATP-binding protein [Nanoarchaeota archaeon]
MPLLKVLGEGEKFDPFVRPDVTIKYVRNARNSVERPEGIDQLLAAYVTEPDAFFKVLHGRKTQFVDERILIATNELVRKLLGQSPEEYYIKLGRNTCLAMKSRLAGTAAAVSPDWTVAKILQRTAQANTNFNTVTEMSAEVEEDFAWVTRITKPDQRKMYAIEFGELDHLIMVYNCYITRGVLSAAPEIAGLKPAEVDHVECELDGDRCVYRVKWEPVKVKSLTRPELVGEVSNLRERLMVTDAEMGALAYQVRQQETERHSNAHVVSDFAELAAHDVGNLLGGTQGCVFMIRYNAERLPPSQERDHLLKYADYLENALQGVGDRVADLGNLAKGMGLTPVTTDLKAHAILDNALTKYKGLAGQQRVEIVRDFQVEETILADRRLEYATRHLVKNALDAMSGGGVLTARNYASGERLVFEVGDTGAGIPPEIQPRLFQKGATFGKSGGQGLGLHEATLIITANKGNIGYETGSKGTRFIFDIPYVESDSDLLRLDL